MERDAIAWLQYSARHNTFFQNEEQCLQLKIKSGWQEFWAVIRRFVPATVSVVPLDSVAMTVQELQEQLSQAWFGVTPLFVLSSEQDGIVRPLPAVVSAFLSQYEGEYHCVVVTPPSQGLAMKCPMAQIAIPDKIDRTFMQILWLVSDPLVAVEVTDYCAQQVFARNRELSLATACSLTMYPALLGRHTAVWCKQWLPKLVPAAYSLFTLSQHLFARDVQKFYEIWVAMRHQYPDEFWLVFWSDQFWNAYNFLLLVPDCGPERAAGQVKYLPFSFLRGGWRRHSAQVCGEQVQRLSQFDTLYKKGVTCIPFETIFAEVLR